MRRWSGRKRGKNESMNESIEGKGGGKKEETDERMLEAEKRRKHEWPSSKAGMDEPLPRLRRRLSVAIPKRQKWFCWTPSSQHLRLNRRIYEERGIK